MTPLSLTILLLIVLCPWRNLCLQRNKLFIVVLRILILIFSSVTLEVLPSYGDPPNELDDLVALYDSELSGIFNRHVPIKKRTVTIRPAAPWYQKNKSLKRGKKDGLSDGGVLPVLCVIVKLTRVNVKFLRTCYLHQEVTIIQI